MTLPLETQTKIEKEAEAYGESRVDHLSNVKEYSTFNDLVGSYIAGATEWAGKAHPVIDALDELLDLLPSGNGLNHYFVKEQVIKAREELAKYKEVSK